MYKLGGSINLFVKGFQKNIKSDILTSSFFLWYLVEAIFLRERFERIYQYRLILGYASQRDSSVGGCFD